MDSFYLLSKWDLSIFNLDSKTGNNSEITDAASKTSMSPDYIQEIQKLGNLFYGENMAFFKGVGAGYLSY